MRHDIDFFHIRIGGQRCEQLFESVARIVCTLPVIRVGAQFYFAARRPGKQYRNAWRFRVVDDLSKAVNCVIELVVKPMHEHEHFAASRRLCCGGHSGHKSLFVEIVRGNRHEIPTRIARKGLRPLDLANLAGVVGRNRNGNSGVGCFFRSLAVKHLAWVGSRAPSRCGGQHLHAGRAFRGLRDGHQHALRQAAGACAQ